MRWMDIKHGRGMPDKKVRKIAVKFVGIPKLVIVRTKQNGGVL